jgi:hypothetical protein
MSRISNDLINVINSIGFLKGQSVLTLLQASQPPELPGSTSRDG